MRYLVVVLIFCASFSSCRKDFDAELLTTPTLKFSKDTVYLDTVFTNIGSSTYHLKVYNQSSNAIRIPMVKLGKESASFYRLNIDGIPGKVFENVDILAKDSIFIFIETTIDYTQVTNPLYTDEIIFETGLNQQEVQLVTLVKDAHFLYPKKTNNGIETITLAIGANGNETKAQGFYLDENTIFTNEKPYVIYGYCAVKPNTTLTVKAGANIHFHANSGLLISENATLKIEGTLHNKVILEGDRLEPAFSAIPGQWGTIWLKSGSKNNSINHAIIKNASIGILADSVTADSNSLILKNTEIYNSSNYGLLARGASIKGENIVINNSGESTLAITYGGSYEFTHCTFTNFWNGNFRDNTSVSISNYSTTVNNNSEKILTNNLSKALFTNCIIDGNNAIELVLDKMDNAEFNYKFVHNLIKFNDANNAYTGVSLYNFSNTEHYINNLFNEDANYKNEYNNKLLIGENSSVINKAASEGSLAVPFDLLGFERTLPADIGAYQHQIFNK